MIWLEGRNTVYKVCGEAIKNFTNSADVNDRLGNRGKVQSYKSVLKTHSVYG